MTQLLERPARAAAPSGAGSGARVPEVDLARAVAFVVAGVVLAAPVATVPGWVADARVLLPTVFAVVAGLAVACQRSRHAGRGPTWWARRTARRLAVLVGVGLALAHLVPSPSLPGSLDGLRLGDPLVVLGTAAVLAVPVARMATSGVLMTALVLGLLRTFLPLDALLPPPVGPVVPALASALVAVLVGVALGDWLLVRRRGRRVVLGLAVLAALAWGVAFLLDLVGAPVVFQHPAAASAVVAAVLALGHAGTRWGVTDRAVATLGQGASVTLPLYVALVVWGAWLADLPPLRWLATDVLGPPLGTAHASALVGALVAAALLRAGLALVDRDLPLRA